MKNGPGPNDYSEPRLFHIEPKGELQFLGTVIVITDRESASAAEVFTMGMRELPHVIHIGETTTGIFADMRSDQLPNGWIFGYPFSWFTDQNDQSWESIGMVPHLRVLNTEEDIAHNIDRPLELAIALIEKQE